MGLYDGVLRNTPVDIAIDILVVGLLICAYGTQFYQFYRGQGVSITTGYVLAGIIFSHGQLSMSIFDAAVDLPNSSHPVFSQLRDGSLSGWAAFGAILGLLQVIVHWGCCTALLLSMRNLYRGDAASCGAVVIAFLHFAATVMPVLLMASSRSKDHVEHSDFLTAVIIFFVQITGPLTVSALLASQIVPLFRRGVTQGLTSAISTALQAAAVSLLALRWFQRLGSPTWNSESPFSYDRLQLYYSWGFVPINYSLLAIAYLLITVVHLWMGRSRNATDPEREPLLR